VERIAAVVQVRVEMLERRPQQLEGVVPGLGRHAPLFLERHERLGRLRFDFDEVPDAALHPDGEVGELGELELAVLRIHRIRGLPPGDRLPQRRQIGQLGKAHRLPGLHLGELLERLLARAILAHLPAQDPVGLLGPAARAFELIVTEHGSFGWPFAGDGNPEVDDALATVDFEDPVPPVTGFSDFEAHTCFLGPAVSGCVRFCPTLRALPNIGQINLEE
jgi:hypothetical protein